MLSLASTLGAKGATMPVFCTTLNEQGEDNIGTFNTIQIDARLSYLHMIEICQELVKREKACGFRLYKCERIGRNENNIAIFKGITKEKI